MSSEDRFGVTIAWNTGCQSSVERTRCDRVGQEHDHDQQEHPLDEAIAREQHENQIPTPTIGTVIHLGMPKMSIAAAAPPKLATVLATLATSSTTMANRVQRTPKRSRIRSERPCPVTTPSLATISWTMASITIVTGKIHSRLRPVCAPMTE